MMKHLCSMMYALLPAAFLFCTVMAVVAYISPWMADEATGVRISAWATRVALIGVGCFLLWLIGWVVSEARD
jgi:hypothetical protein